MRTDLHAHVIDTDTGEVIAESTINPVDLTVGTRHTFDLYEPGEPPEGATAKYQLTVICDPPVDEPAVEPLPTSALRL